MVLTNDDELARRVRMLASHGMEREIALFQPWPIRNADGVLWSDSAEAGDSTGEKAPWLYQQQELGYNYRITDIQCALGTSQFRRIDEIVKRRRIIVERYQAAFSQNEGLHCPPCPEGKDPAYHLYVLRFKQNADTRRIEACTALRKSGIFAQVHYIPVYLQPWYQRQYGYGLGKCSEAEMVYTNCLSIPLYPSMTDCDIERVIETITVIAGA